MDGLVCLVQLLSASAEYKKTSACRTAIKWYWLVLLLLPFPSYCSLESTLHSLKRGGAQKRSNISILFLLLFGCITYSERMNERTGENLLYACKKKPKRIMEFIFFSHLDKLNKIKRISSYIFTRNWILFYITL